MKIQFSVTESRTYKELELDAWDCSKLLPAFSHISVYVLKVSAEHPCLHLSNLYMIAQSFVAKFGG